MVRSAPSGGSFLTAPRSSGRASRDRTDPGPAPAAGPTYRSFALDDPAPEPAPTLHSGLVSARAPRGEVEVTDPELIAVRIAREGRTAAAAALRGGEPAEVLAVLLLDQWGRLRLKPAVLAKLAAHPDPRVGRAAKARLAAR